MLTSKFMAQMCSNKSKRAINFKPSKLRVDLFYKSEWITFENKI